MTFVSSLRMTVAARAFGLIAILAVAACSTTEPLLNSERIEKKFGTFGIDLIASDSRKRIANLYSMEGGRRVCRTWATVQFPDVIDSRVTSEHVRILGGQPMGAVFKANGWQISKRNLQIGSRPLTPLDNEMVQMMQIPKSAKIAYHTYVFSVSKDGHALDYAVITETHHPDYLSRTDLEEIYGTVAETAADVRLTLGSGAAPVVSYHGI
ncbi:MAG: hypothetical protein WDZ50_05045 [Woeseia sp.]